MIIVRNNIAFRVESSQAIAKFKQHENFILGQILYGKYDFSETSREIILLNFRLWTDWLNQIENTISFLEEEKLTQSDKNHILYKAKAVENKYTKALISNSEIFKTKKSKCWLEVHKIVGYEHLIGEINKIVGCSKVRAFNTIVDALIETMLMVMYELWEIKLVSHVEYENKLAFTEMCNLKLNSKNPVNFLLKRAEIYSKYYGEVDFVIQNYTSQKICPGYRLSKEFKEKGFTLTVPANTECVRYKADTNKCPLNGKECMFKKAV